MTPGPRSRTSTRGVALLAVVPLLVALAWRAGDLAVPPRHEQAWRDSDGLGVARCFVREGFDLLRPRVMERGSRSGIVGMEFPIVNAAGAALMKVGGIRDWLARLPCWLSLIPLMLGGWALGRRVLGDEAGAAMAAGCLVLQPLVIIYARKCVPEVPMLAALVWGLALAHDAISRASLPRAVSAGALFALAAVLKPTGFAVAVPLLLWLRGALRESRRRAMVWAAAGVVGVLPLAAAVLWYSHARALGVEYGLPLFKLTHDWFEWTRALSKGTFHAALFFRIFHLYLLWPTVVLMAIRWRDTVATARRHPDLVAWTGAALVVVMLFGMHIRGHPYYAFGLLVPLALFAGAFAARVCGTFSRPALARYAFMGVFAATAVLRVEQRASDPSFDPFARYDPDRLAVAMARMPRGGLTIATDDQTNVTALVILDRLGWALNPRDLTPQAIATLRAEGATLLVETIFGGWLAPETRAALPAPIWSDDQLRVYDLTSGAGSLGVR